MNIKTVISGITCIGLTAVLTLSTIGIPGVIDTKNERDMILDRQASAEYRLTNTQNNLIRVVEELNASRTFDVYYGDIENIAKVFDAFGGITIKSLSSADHKNNFVDVGPVIDASSVSAVHYTLEVKDVINTLGLLEQMELPVYSIVITNNNTIDVVFLTGGAV